ncbi:hypothetical protein BDV33DRAFT_191172 [Aspergillus novoparasiticus]|uniref:Transcription factor domain-containing protein n=1 Tax=Aspergillus novoparasiticus TaxID=986946 RepID=A0A5N6ESU5_9EURO|nr:hypothetical protein BDV33DRAFT_191172 [Aspergillus novoparasiticus]
MEPPLVEKRRSTSHQVCDNCHSRKLGSLRGLLDRQTDTYSLPSEMDNDSLPMETPEVGPILTNRPHFAYELHNWISIVPLTDAQMASRHRLSRVQGLAWNRLQVLESALYAASQFTENVGGFRIPPNIDDQSEEQGKIPAPEFLTWMLKDIGTDRFGPYVRDYFRHVSKHSLEKMGMSLLRKDASPSDMILYTVCINSVAYKFLTTCVTVPSNSAGSIKKDPTRKYTISCTSTGGALWGENCLQDLHRYWPQHQCCKWTGAQNYAWKLGRSKGFLEATPGGILHASTRLTPPISELLLVYLDLAQIQDGIIPFIKDSSEEGEHAVPPVTNLREQLLPRMKDIRSRIDEITPPSDRWKGLDSHSEIAALDFAYHSIMTTILHLIQLTPGQTLTAKDLYLDSARQELSALVSICLSANKQSTVAFLHWTLLYYPLTAVFVLFCNTVVTSHIGDFNLLKTVADCLTQSGTASEHIANLQKLFQEFVSLSQRFLNEENSTALTNQGAQTSPSQQGTSSQDVIHNSNSPHWLNTSTTWSSGILAGLDNHSFDPSFSMLELSYGDSTFFLGGGADIPFSSA